MNLCTHPNTIREILGKATEGFEEEDEGELTANPWGIVKRADLPLPRFYFLTGNRLTAIEHEF